MPPAPTEMSPRPASNHKAAGPVTPMNARAAWPRQ